MLPFRTVENQKTFCVNYPAIFIRRCVCVCNTNRDHHHLLQEIDTYYMVILSGFCGCA